MGLHLANSQLLIANTRLLISQNLDKHNIVFIFASLIQSVKIYES
jgi:hypothetical protein